MRFRGSRHTRTVTAGFGADRTTHPSAWPHHALYDAVAQAHDLIDMLNAGGA